MAENMRAWHQLVEDAVSGLADEGLQRRAWFGMGPEVASVEEIISQFFESASVEEFLERDDSGLNNLQTESGRHLVNLMHDLIKETPKYPEFIDPSKMIVDPRWIKIRESATQFLNLLSKGGAQN